MSAARTHRWSRPLAAVATFGALLFALTGGMSPAAAEQPQTPNLGKLENELSNVESRIAQLQAEFNAPVARTLTSSIERRLVDAHVFFEQGLYAKASVLLTDIVQNPRYRGARDIPEATFLLGRALFLDRNYHAAEKAFTKLIDPPHPKYFQDALAHLVEASLHAHDDTKLSAYFDRIASLPVSARSADTVFVMGKALFQIGKYERADRILTSIARGAPRYLHAQYYIGTIRVAQGDLDRAEQTFLDIVSASQLEERPDQALLELVHIALGRLFAERGESERAVDQYQFVPHHSKNYETALYEISWAYVNARQYKKAADTLDLLILNVNDEEIEVEANVLRGRLFVMLGEHDAAGEAYQRVIDRFARLRTELSTFVADRKNVDEFFHWLLRKDDETFALSRPMSERLTRWVTSGAEMSDMRRVMEDLSRARRDLEESREMATKLRAALDSPNRVELFTNLRDGWTRSLELENALVELNRSVLTLREGRLDIDACSGSAGKLSSLRGRRLELEAAFRLVPQTAAEHARRHDVAQSRYADLKRQGFMVETSLTLLAKQVAAIETWLRSRAVERGKDTPITERDRDIAARVREERRRLGEMETKLRETMAALDREAARIGAGDEADASDAGLKRRLMEVHRQEARLLAMCEGQQGRPSGIYDEIQARVWRALESIGRTSERIAETARLKTEEVRRLVAAEERDLQRFERSLATAERQALSVARELGDEFFRAAEQRLAEVVLEADLGLVDLAWFRQQELSDRIQEINTQRRAEMMRLDKMQDAVMKGAEPKDEAAPEDGGEK